MISQHLLSSVPHSVNSHISQLRLNVKMFVFFPQTTLKFGFSFIYGDCLLPQAVLNASAQPPRPPPCSCSTQEKSCSYKATRPPNSRPKSFREGLSNLVELKWRTTSTSATSHAIAHGAEEAGSAFDLSGLQPLHHPDRISHPIYFLGFSLFRNPWECDCTLEWLKEWMRATSCAAIPCALTPSSVGGLISVGMAKVNGRVTPAELNSDHGLLEIAHH
ncbi:nyctalopin [Lates japonicus]|uniref:Nyctalopin n=1 Tax=Lates japonicus TaxID=270547 RepID=A0AAD3RIU9_LATJO|nr:nyctalopin [Lates japonicus]